MGELRLRFAEILFQKHHAGKAVSETPTGFDRFPVGAFGAFAQALRPIARPRWL